MVQRCPISSPPTADAVEIRLPISPPTTTITTTVPLIINGAKSVPLLCKSHQGRGVVAMVIFAKKGSKLSKLPHSLHSTSDCASSTAFHRLPPSSTAERVDEPLQIEHVVFLKRNLLTGTASQSWAALMANPYAGSLATGLLPQLLTPWAVH